MTVADDRTSGVILGNESKAPVSPYIVYIVMGTLGKLETAETTSRALARTKDLACELVGCRTINRLSKGCLGESYEGE